MENTNNQPEWTGEQKQVPSCAQPTETGSLYELEATGIPNVSTQGLQQHSPAPQLVDSEKHTLGADPFQPVIEMLQRLDQDDPKFAAQAARLVGLYRRLWESCVSKHIDSQRLGEANRQLRTTNFQMLQESVYLKQRHDYQEAQLAVFEHGLAKAREGIAGVLRDWDNCSAREWAAPAESEFQEVQ